MNMRTVPVAATILVCLCVLLPAPAWCWQEAKPAPTTQPAQPDAADKPDAEKPATIQVDSVAATVDGRPIFEREVTEMSDDVIHNQVGSRQVPVSMLANMRSQIRADVVQALIDNNLIAEDAAKAKIAVSDDEFTQTLTDELAARARSSGRTMEELGKDIQESTSKPPKVYIAEVAAKPQFRHSVRLTKLMTLRHPDDMKITDDTIKSKYDQQLEKEFKQPETVHASHILVKTDQANAEQKAAAKTKIESLLAEAKKPGADFAELAKKNSDCPSSAQGGDLGTFVRAQMVEPFANAAFAMKPGEISDVVETQFGYHIIKVAERNPARTIALADAEPLLRIELTREKAHKLGNQDISKLRETAKIVITGEQKPAEGSAATQPSEGNAATPPAEGKPAEKPADAKPADAKPADDHAGHDHKHVP